MYVKAIYLSRNAEVCSLVTKSLQEFRPDVFRPTHRGDGLRPVLPKICRLLALEDYVEWQDIHNGWAVRRYVE